MPSTTVGSASVVVSPSAWSCATSRRSRRMILPERVFGSSSVKRIDFGFAIGPVDERRLHLGRGDVVARHEHDVVDPAEQPEVALVVALGAVAREVLAVEAAPVRVTEPLRVAPYPA